MENRPKISVDLVGGMANYIFQLAAAYSYSLKYNKQFIINTKDAVRIQKPINNYKNNIFKNVFEFDTVEKFDKFTIYNEPHFNYNEIPYIEGDVCLRGYFQSDKYFAEYDKEIRELFSFPKEIVETIRERYKNLLNKETCSIHCRVGDYAPQQQYHPVQNMNYYSKAIKKIGMDKTFLVFSDDISFCKTIFPEMDNFIFFEGTEDYEDLLLMELVNNNIVANSSFSWWGSWLNDNKEKVVIAPKQWFGSAYSIELYDTKDLYCQNWIKL